MAQNNGIVSENRALSPRANIDGKDQDGCINQYRIEGLYRVNRSSDFEWEQSWTLPAKVVTVLILTACGRG